ncbi:wall-associated receptor kinase 2-like isoform X2 [Fagus crenata]
MAWRGMLFHQQLLLALIILAATATAASQDSQPNSSCIYCGSFCIHYPFGTISGQYLDESFHINCVNISGTLKPFLGNANLEVLNISLDGELRVSTSVTRYCPGNSSEQRAGSNFLISYKRNNLIGVGFNTVSYIGGASGTMYGTGCVSPSSGTYDRRHRDIGVVNGSCSGVGCCNTSIPERVTDFVVEILSTTVHLEIRHANMLREIKQAMHVRQQIVHVTIPTTVLGIVAIAPQAFEGTHTSMMVVKILMSAKLQNLASILQSAKTLLGVSIARVRRGSKAMA